MEQRLHSCRTERSLKKQFMIMILKQRLREMAFLTKGLKIVDSSAIKDENRRERIPL